MYGRSAIDLCWKKYVEYNTLASENENTWYSLCETWMEVEISGCPSEHKEGSDETVLYE